MGVAYKDYYQTLGVGRDADAKAIKQAYRRLARRYHPDQNPGDRTAAERFKEVNEAHEVLSDPGKRRRYDRLGADWARYAEAPPGPGPRAGSGFRVRTADAADLGDFSEFFRTFFGDLGTRGGPFGDDLFGEAADAEPGGGRSRRAARGEDYESPVDIGLEEAFQGTRRTVELDRPEPCGTCRGTGRQERAACPACGGRGQVTRRHRLEVHIPAGVRDGSRVRAVGEGGAGRHGERGDLYLRVRVRPHPVFERRDDDLHVEVPLAMWEAALGTELEVSTLRGKVSMKIPPETASGQTFRLPGYGMPHLRGGGRGDQYVRVRIVPPRGLTPRERALFEELRGLRRETPRD
jgi:DnaJ-class molecular chaperone